jgi:hypothetical protein
MMKTQITEERIHTDKIAYPDSLEIGRAGARLTVAFNIDDPEHSRTRIDEGLALRDYAVNGLMISIEKELVSKAMRAKK